MEDLFDFKALMIRQPGKLLANRAKYEIFNAERQLLALAVASESHARLGLISKAMPNATVLAVTTPSGELVLSLAMRHSEWTTDIHGPANELIGRIRTGDSRRHYTLLDDQDRTVGTVVGDLGLKKFSVAGSEGGRFGQVRKTWAGLRKEVLTSADHYKVEFTGPVSQLVRVLTVMMPIVLDLTLYEPV
jgi:hypothetical protein